MKNKLLILIFIIGLGALAFYLFSPGPFSQLTEEKKTGILDILPRGLGIGDLAPDFVSEDVDGNRFSLSDFRDKKPVLLVFWATWCGQCAKEMPDLKTFTQRYQGVIQVIAVDSGEPRQTIKEYIREKEINFLILLDEDRKIWNQYLVRGTPFHFLIDKDGKIITTRPGLAFLTDLETMLTMLK